MNRFLPPAGAHHLPPALPEALHLPPALLCMAALVAHQSQSSASPSLLQAGCRGLPWTKLGKSNPRLEGAANKHTITSI